jgi:alpha-ribazole phosphatase
MNTCLLWRHPKPRDAAARCIGQCDLSLDPRRAKRLAHRIRAHARREGLPHVVWTSPLERCAAVGRWLRCFGFQHHIDADLMELDFGAWDGLAWREISQEEVQAWEQDFLHHPPGGGESLQALMLRVQRFMACRSGPMLIVGHAGWINALCWMQSHPEAPPTAARWPPPPRYGQLVTR